MADIKKELNDIKNAVYGREVRGSIHDGIKKINDEVENATDLSESAKHQVENIQQQVNQLVIEGDSSVEAAQARVDAEGKSFSTLKERLDTKETQFSTQLAQTSQDINVINDELKNKRDKNEKITKSDYDLSQDANKWNINDFDEHTRQIFLEAQGIDVNYVLGRDAIVRENYADRSVYPEKTTFAKSKNLAGELVRGLSITGPFGEWEFTEAENAYTYVTKLEKGKTYAVWGSEDSNRFRVATSIGYPKIGEKPSRNVVDLSSSERFWIVTLEGDEDHIVVYVATSGTNPPTLFQIEEGRKKTDYAEPGTKVTIDFDDESIPASALKDISDVFKSTGILIGSARAFNISLKEKKIYTLRAGGFVYSDNERYDLKDGEWSYSDTETNSIFIVFNKETSDINFVEISEKLSSDDILLGVIRKDEGLYRVNGLHSLEGKPVEVRNPAKSAFIVGNPSSFNVSFRDNKIIICADSFVLMGDDRHQLEETTVSFEDVDAYSVYVYYDAVSREIIADAWRNIARIVGAGEGSNLYYIGTIRPYDKVAYINGLYSINGEAVVPYTGGAGTDPNNGRSRIFISDKVSGNYEPTVPDVNVWDLDIYKVYGFYDALVDEYPEYVSRTFLGNDEGGFPLYRYDFKPTPIINAQKDIPKIIATCTHGHENWATYAMALFFDELARNWKEKDVLRMLRWNVHFIVVPNKNPWGFNNHSRLNFNGVDLARNYPAGWSPDYTDIEYDYPGTEPLSEFGTQVFDQLLKENQDALFVVDSHNYGGDPATGGDLLYIGSRDNASLELGEQHVRLIGTLAKMDGYVSPGARVGQVRTSVAGGSLTRQVNDYYNMHGLLLETSNTLSEYPDKRLYLNMKSIGNMFLVILRYFSM